MRLDDCIIIWFQLLAHSANARSLGARAQNRKNTNIFRISFLESKSSRYGGVLFNYLFEGRGSRRDFLPIGHLWSLVNYHFINNIKLQKSIGKKSEKKIAS